MATINKEQGFTVTDRSSQNIRESHQKNEISRKIMILDKDAKYRPITIKCADLRKKEETYKEVFLNKGLKEQEVRMEVEKSFPTLKAVDYRFGETDNSGVLYFHDGDQWSTANITKWINKTSVLYVVPKREGGPSMPREHDDLPIFMQESSSEDKPTTMANMREDNPSEPKEHHDLPFPTQETSSEVYPKVKPTERPKFLWEWDEDDCNGWLYGTWEFVDKPYSRERQSEELKRKGDPFMPQGPQEQNVPNDFSSQEILSEVYPEDSHTEIVNMLWEWDEDDCNGWLYGTWEQSNLRFPTQETSSEEYPEDSHTEIVNMDLDVESYPFEKLIKELKRTPPDDTMLPEPKRARRGDLSMTREQNDIPYSIQETSPEYVVDLKEKLFNMTASERSLVSQKYKEKIPAPLNTQFPDRLSKAEAVAKSKKRK